VAAAMVAQSRTKVRREIWMVFATATLNAKRGSWRKRGCVYGTRISDHVLRDADHADHVLRDADHADHGRAQPWARGRLVAGAICRIGRGGSTRLSASRRHVDPVKQSRRKRRPSRKSRSSRGSRWIHPSWPATRACRAGRPSRR
jgi:hypothetical protein